MKKLLLMSSMMLIACSSVMAQKKADVKTKKSFSSVNAPFVKGSNMLGLGIGFGGAYGYGFGASYSPAIAVVYDHGIINNVGPGTIGIGGIIGYKTARADYGYFLGNYKFRWTNIIVAARGTYHLTLLADKAPKFDPYGGVMAGLRIETFNDDGYGGPFDDDGGVYPAVGLFIGAKYNFSPHFGAFSELGYDVTLFKIGVHLAF